MFNPDSQRTFAARIVVVVKVRARVRFSHLLVLLSLVCLFGVQLAVVGVASVEAAVAVKVASGGAAVVGAAFRVLSLVLRLEYFERWLVDYLVNVRDPPPFCVVKPFRSCDGTHSSSGHFAIVARNSLLTNVSLLPCSPPTAAAKLQLAAKALDVHKHRTSASDVRSLSRRAGLAAGGADCS